MTQDDIRPIRRCNIDGCDKPHHGHGMCRTHHGRWIKYGTPDKPTRPTKPKRTCNRKNCGRVHYAKGLCVKHWRKIQYQENKEARRKRLPHLEPIENNDTCIECGETPMGGGYWCYSCFCAYVDEQDRRNPGRREHRHGTYETRRGHRRRGEPFCPTCFASTTDWLEVMAS